MATIEEILADTKLLFEKQAATAMADVMDEIYTKYLPHVESDNCFNVTQQAREWLLRFMAGRDCDEIMYVDVMSPYTYEAKEVRQKIYEDNREEIQKAIGVDLQEQIDNLKEQLSAAYRRY